MDTVIIQLSPPGGAYSKLDLQEGGGAYSRGGAYSKGSFPEGGLIRDAYYVTMDEAKSHDDYAIGIYKPVDTAMKEKETLVGHLPIELSFLLCNFLESEENCGLSFSPTGPRLLEDGLVVPRKYIAKGPYETS